METPTTRPSLSGDSQSCRDESRAAPFNPEIAWDPWPHCMMGNGNRDLAKHRERPEEKQYS